MKFFLITFERKADESELHPEIQKFVEALNRDPELAPKIAYRSMKTKAGRYYHIAAAEDGAADILGKRDYFKHYTEQTKRLSGGTVETFPLELVAETTRGI
jgi:hypothetical protein